jgi:PIN domain nuclease of toxin-antitoxin system
MAAMIHLDTHAVVWLAAGELERFASSVRLLLEHAECAVSPMVRLELDYLYEIGRLKVPVAI